MVKRQGGFTLVELTLVLALTSGFALLALGSYSAIRNQAQFNDSMERLQTAVLGERQEALATIKLGGSGDDGTDADNVSFGRLLIFTPGSSEVKVYSLRTANSEAPDPGQAVTAIGKETTAITLQWGAQFAGPQAMVVAFTRSLTDGSLRTTVVANQATWTYGDFVGGATEVGLPVTGSGQSGQLLVDQNTNGVTVRFQ